MIFISLERKVGIPGILINWSKDSFISSIV